MKRKFYRYFIYYEFYYVDVPDHGMVSAFFDTQYKIDNNTVLRQIAGIIQEKIL